MLSWGSNSKKENENTGNTGEYKEVDKYNKFGGSREDGSSSIQMPTTTDMVTSMGTSDLGKKKPEFGGGFDGK